jgi:outer membrane protein assembly factor BamB
MRIRGTPKLFFLSIMAILGVFTPTAHGQGRPHGKAKSVDWPTFLFNPTHSSATSSGAIDKANVGTLIEAWHWQANPATKKDQPIPAVWASPIVSNGTVYIGSDTGVFYALDLATGQEVWEQFLGYRPKLTCHNKGISATATIAPDPVTQQPTVYAPGGDGYLYALDAATGTINWKSVIALPSGDANDYYNWSSPNVVNGKIYIGVSAQCDDPLTDNTGVEQFDQATGNLMHQYFTVRPTGYVGGSVWSSVAVTSDSVFAATGNPRPEGYPKGVTSDDISLVRLDPNTLAKLDKWHLKTKPGSDEDFGAPPVVFTALPQGQPTEMVGVSNKNGVFYALNSHNLAAGPVWEFRVSAFPITPTVAAAVWDGTNLYVAGNQIAINGTRYQGSINKLDPTTGLPVWQTPLESAVLGSPSLNGSGILAVATFESKGGVGTKAPNGTHLVDSSTGAILNYLSVNDDYEWSQPIFAGNYLLTGLKTLGLFVSNPSSDLFSDGFESGNLKLWKKHFGVKIEKTLVENGVYAAEATATGKGGAYANATLSSSKSDLSISVYVYIKSQATMANLISFKDINGHTLFTVNVSNQGKLGTVNGTTRKSVSSPFTLSANAWHLLQVHLIDATSGQTSIRVDGNHWIPKLSQNQSFSGVAVQTVQFGDSAAKHVFDIVYDDLDVLVPALQ